MGTMKTVSLAAWLLACGFSLDAQITVALNPRPDGSTEVRLRNNSTVELTAFVVSVNYVTGVSGLSDSFTLWVDPAIDSLPAINSYTRQRAVGSLPPNGEFTWLPERATIVTPKSGHLLLERPVVAGIFADDTTAGDTTLLTQLVDRRRNMLLAVEMSLETLLDADGRNLHRGQLIERFRMMVDSARRWYLPPAQQVGLGLYRSMIGKLVNLREGPAGLSFPPDSFLARETALLNRQRVELLAVLQSRPGLPEISRN